MHTNGPTTVARPDKPAPLTVLRDVSAVEQEDVRRADVDPCAAGMLMVHNHPSGDPEPSPDDLHLTAEAIAAGRLLDLPVLDHIILGRDGYVSLRDRGVGFDRC